MGTIHKIGDSYYIEFEARGLKYQQKAGDNEEQARALLDSIEAKIRQGEMAIVVRDVPIPLFVKDFSEFAVKTYPVRTAQRLVSAAQHFQDFILREYPSSSVLSSVTPKVIENYKFFIVHGGNKPWVVNFTLLLLREMFEYAIKLGYLNDNPTLHIRFVVDLRKLDPHAEKNLQAKQYLSKGISLFRLAHLMQWNDVLRTMPFYPFFRNPV